MHIAHTARVRLVQNVTSNSLSTFTRFLSAFMLTAISVAGANASTLSDLTGSLAEKTWVQMPANSSLDGISIQDSHFYFANSG